MHKSHNIARAIKDILYELVCWSVLFVFLLFIFREREGNVIMYSNYS